MFRKIARWVLIMMSLLIVAINVVPAVAFTTRSASSLLFRNAGAPLSDHLRATVSLSQEMVDDAIDVLSAGWQGMTQTEREEFRRLYDPAGTGDIDAGFVEAVLDNYLLIGKAVDGKIVIEFEAESQACFGRQLYYTDFLRVHVCPYYLLEGNRQRQARTFIHEMAHKALVALDRPYYRPTNKRYAQLTPKGHFTAQIPIVGPLVRELLRGDTLYHPDAYAHFALAVYDEK